MVFEDFEVEFDENGLLLFHLDDVDDDDDDDGGLIFLEFLVPDSPAGVAFVVVVAGLDCRRGLSGVWNWFCWEILGFGMSVVFSCLAIPNSCVCDTQVVVVVSCVVGCCLRPWMS